MDKNMMIGEIYVGPSEAIPEDIVNSPDHYCHGNMETIEVIKGSMSKEKYLGYLQGNIIKYVCRAEYKGGVIDIDKAKVYLDWLRKEISA